MGATNNRQTHTSVPEIIYLLNTLAERGRPDNHMNIVPLNLVLKLFADNRIAFLLTVTVYLLCTMEVNTIMIYAVLLDQLLSLLHLASQIIRQLTKPFVS